MTESVLARLDVVDFSDLYPERHDLMLSTADDLIRDIGSMVAQTETATGYRLRFGKRIYGDTLDIYFDPGPMAGPQLKALLRIVSEVQLTLLSKGIFVRGAVASGELIHTPEVFTGQALVDAKRIEGRVGGMLLGVSEQVRGMLSDALVFEYTSDVAKRLLPRYLTPDGSLNYIGVLEADRDAHRTGQELRRSHRLYILDAVRHYAGLLDAGDDGIIGKCVGRYEATILYHNSECASEEAALERIRCEVERHEGTVTRFEVEGWSREFRGCADRLATVVGRPVSVRRVYRKSSASVIFEVGPLSGPEAHDRPWHPSSRPRRTIRTSVYYIHNMGGSVFPTVEAGIRDKNKITGVIGIDEISRRML